MKIKTKKRKRSTIRTIFFHMGRKIEARLVYSFRPIRRKANHL